MLNLELGLVLSSPPSHPALFYIGMVPLQVGLVKYPRPGWYRARLFDTLVGIGALFSIYSSQTLRLRNSRVGLAVDLSFVHLLCLGSSSRVHLVFLFAPRLKILGAGVLCFGMGMVSSGLARLFFRMMRLILVGF